MKLALLTLLLAALAAAQTTFIPVTPCRLVDTRLPVGLFGGPSLAPQTTRSFVIPASGCLIPLTAVAYSLNVTVVPQGPLQYLTIWPAGQTRPNVSTLNAWTLSGPVANAAIVPAGTGGAVSVYVTDATNLVLDINGYWVPETGLQVIVPTPVVMTATITTTPTSIGITPQPTIGSFPGPASITNISGNGIYYICAPVNSQTMSIYHWAAVVGTFSGLTDAGVGAGCPTMGGVQAIAYCAVAGNTVTGCVPMVGAPAQ